MQMQSTSNFTWVQISRNKDITLREEEAASISNRWGFKFTAKWEPEDLPDISLSFLKVS